MRRRIAALAAAVAAVSSVPATATPAAARTGGSITVTTIDRHGRVVATRPQAVLITHGGSVEFGSNRRKRLPRGRYDVFVIIPDETDGSRTVAVKRVVVNGAEKLTVDARQGRRVRAVLHPAPPAGLTQTLGVAICLNGDDEVRVWRTDRALYAIPSSLPEISTGVSATWSPVFDADGPAFLGAAGYSGVPRRLAPTIRQSALATITVSGRGGYAVGQQLVQLAGNYQNTCRSDVLDAQLYGTVPYSVTFHVPAGPWSVSQMGADFGYGYAHQYRAGHRYRVTVGRATWGPDGAIPSTDAYSHVLRLPNWDMFVDPALRQNSRERMSLRLTHRGHVLLDRRGVDDDAFVGRRLSASGWYTLNMTATRISNAPLATSLSTRSSVRMRFFARPDHSEFVRAFLARFLPLGLDRFNAASDGRTSVELRPTASRRDRGDASRRNSVRDMHAWYSYDGRTWHAVRVVHAGGHWHASVPNPASGYVSLRARIDDTHGGWATTTVIRAYAVR